MANQEKTKTYEVVFLTRERKKERKQIFDKKIDR